QAQKRAQEGYTYREERGFDVAERVAENEAVGQMTNLGVGLGTMAGVGGAVGGVVGGAVNDALGNTAPAVQSAPSVGGFCENCGTKLAQDAAFCEECGAAVAKPSDTCQNCGYKFERWYNMIWMEKIIGDHDLKSSIPPFSRQNRQLNGSD
ncbi:MAG: zinc ribbon domain-containing protein, partial [Oscillospiraceae bacterium]|nr:zinc ribbon domain-containing protein [Oscillospiraceae bacterium]